MKTFMRIFDREWFRGVVMTIMVLGIVIALLGVWQYSSASQALAANPAQQLAEEQAADEEAVETIETQAEGRMLLASDIERRQLQADQYYAMITAGIGLAVLAIGWIGLDVARSRRQRVTSDVSAEA